MNSMKDEWNKNRSLQFDHADLGQSERHRPGKREREAKNKKALDDMLETGLEESFRPLTPSQSPSRPTALKISTSRKRRMPTFCGTALLRALVCH